MKKTPKKKNDKTLFVAAVIVFALAVGLFVGSYARYYSSVSVTGGTIETAAWDFSVNGQPSSLTLDVLTDSNCDVYNLVGNKIQPGSFGSCTITLSAANSDVDVHYDATFGQLTWSGGTPAVGFDWKIVDTTNSGTTNVTSANGTITAGGTHVFTLEWGWTYNSSETTGSYNPYAGQTLTFAGSTIVGYQVQPTEQYDSTFNPQPQSQPQP